LYTKHIKPKRLTIDEYGSYVCINTNVFENKPHKQTNKQTN